MRISKGFLSLAFGLAMLPSAAQAQDWRTVNSVRQLNGESELRVDVHYGAGRLKISPTGAAALYRAMLRYDAEQFRPISRYENGRLRIGVESGSVRARNTNPGELDLSLGERVALDLNLKFGAGTADIELGGLRVVEAEIQTGASDTRIRISRPNPERCANAKFEVGAAQFNVEGLGNLNCKALRVAGGVGEVTLDFSGRMRGSMTTEIDMGLGSLTLRVPRGTAVSIRKKGVLASFDSEGLIKRGDVYYSENYEKAEHKLEFNIDAALGSIRVLWVNERSR